MTDNTKETAQPSKDLENAAEQKPVSNAGNNPAHNLPPINVSAHVQRPLWIPGPRPRG